MDKALDVLFIISIFAGGAIQAWCLTTFFRDIIIKEKTEIVSEK